MKFSQMSVIKSLISENTINRKEFMRFKRFFLWYHFQISRWYCSSMSSQNIFACFFRIPNIVISNTTVASNFMSSFNSFKILFIIYGCFFRMWNKESIMSITCWMSLWLEERVEIPKRRLDVFISVHFFKTHL